MSLPPLFEDSAILILEKPAGIVVDRSESQRTETIQDILGRHFPSLKTIERCGIVHRLDKETSGILIVAKSRIVQETLQRAFAMRQVQKEYVALLHGQFLSQRRVTAAIGRNPRVREKFTVLDSGRPSETRFTSERSFLFPLEKLRGWNIRVKEAFALSYRAMTLVMAYPVTGRTHQIRVHAQFIGHPVVADRLYAGRKTNRIDRKWCPRQFLHARNLTFLHPVTREQMTVTSPLPEDLREALTVLTEV